MFQMTHLSIISNKTSVIKQNEVGQKIAFFLWTIRNKVFQEILKCDKLKILSKDTGNSLFLVNCGVRVLN